MTLDVVVYTMDNGSHIAVRINEFSDTAGLDTEWLAAGGDGDRRDAIMYAVDVIQDAFDRILRNHPELTLATPRRGPPQPEVLTDGGGIEMLS